MSFEKNKIPNPLFCLHFWFFFSSFLFLGRMGREKGKKIKDVMYFIRIIYGCLRNGWRHRPNKPPIGSRSFFFFPPCYSRVIRFVRFCFFRIFFFDVMISFYNTSELQRLELNFVVYKESGLDKKKEYTHIAKVYQAPKTSWGYLLDVHWILYVRTDPKSVLWASYGYHLDLDILWISNGQSTGCENAIWAGGHFRYAWIRHSEKITSGKGRDPKRD